jgi:hypothetical protein
LDCDKRTLKNQNYLFKVMIGGNFVDLQEATLSLVAKQKRLLFDTEHRAAAGTSLDEWVRWW